MVDANSEQRVYVYALAPQVVDATGRGRVAHKVSEAGTSACSSGSAEWVEMTIHIEEALTSEVIEMFGCSGRDGWSEASWRSSGHSRGSVRAQPRLIEVTHHDDLLHPLCPLEDGGVELVCVAVQR